jgi:uncharacterized cupredoxin-like copper-binding protein
MEIAMTGGTMKPVFRLLSLVALSAIAGVLVSGCGGDDGTTATNAETEAAAPTAQSVEIKMGEFFFDPKNATAQGGPTTIEAPNTGQVEHELVLFKSDMNPAQLPTEANGEVDEEKMDEVAEEVGEIPDVEAGNTKSEEFELTPGKYVMFCNLPGHYAAGMYGTLTVTK